MFTVSSRVATFAATVAVVRVSELVTIATPFLIQLAPRVVELFESRTEAFEANTSIDSQPERVVVIGPTAGADREAARRSQKEFADGVLPAFADEFPDPPREDLQ